jgi:HD-GYP domain-containing protein (c-di-GMP phosphodiesterase class II)
VSPLFHEPPPFEEDDPPVLSEVEGRLRTFLAELDRRTGYVRGHSRAVCELAVRIARQLGVAGDQLLALAVGALLHDIGKVFIDGRVLGKAAPLSQAEWETIRLHPALGEALLAPTISKADVLAVVRWHHERWDGRGYPDRLDGPEIPLGARIVAAADAFSAMRESRAYRPPLPLDDAVEELQRTSWSQFDGVCVSALVDSLS